MNYANRVSYTDLIGLHDAAPLSLAQSRLLAAIPPSEPQKPCIRFRRPYTSPAATVATGSMVDFSLDDFIRAAEAIKAMGPAPTNTIEMTRAELERLQLVARPLLTHECDPLGAEASFCGLRIEIKDEA